MVKKTGAIKAGAIKAGVTKLGKPKPASAETKRPRPAPANVAGTVGSPFVLERLHAVVMSRRGADPAISHSARLLSRGTAKVAQKFGEEAVECVIEAVAGNTSAVVTESADVLYHLLVLWVDAGVEPAAVWAELTRREGVSGIAEKASRPHALRTSSRNRKIP